MLSIKRDTSDASCLLKKGQRMPPFGGQRMVQLQAGKLTTHSEPFSISRKFFELSFYFCVSIKRIGLSAIDDYGTTGV